jgi:transcriptional regulator with XRE-family HTH domain
MQRHGRPIPPITLEKLFGLTLRELRHERGISQETLAFESGYHPTYIGQIERGTKNPSLRTIVNFASVLSLSPSELIRRFEERIGEGRLASRESVSRRRQ